MDQVHLPAWNQLFDPDVYGDADVYASQDCGEECAAIVTNGCIGATFTERSVREQMPGHAQTGYTTGDDIARFLRTQGIACESIATSALDMRNRVVQGLEEHKPAIILGYYAGPSVLHWVVPVFWRPPVCRFLDPYGGVIRTMPGEWVRKWFRGQVVLVDMVAWR